MIRVKGGEVPGGASLAPKIGPLGMVRPGPTPCAVSLLVPADAMLQICVYICTRHVSVAIQRRSRMLLRGLECSRGVDGGEERGVVEDTAVGQMSASGRAGVYCLGVLM
jgi:hypothetical protein